MNELKIFIEIFLSTFFLVFGFGRIGFGIIGLILFGLIGIQVFLHSIGAK